MTTAARSRSDSINGAGSSAKKARMASTASESLNLPSGQALSDHQAEYAASSPYKYSAIGGLITDELVSANPQLHSLSRS